MAKANNLHISLFIIRLTGLNPEQKSPKLFVSFNCILLTLVTTLTAISTVNFKVEQLTPLSYLYYVWVKLITLIFKKKALKQLLQVVRKMIAVDNDDNENTIYRKYLIWQKGYVAYLGLCMALVIIQSLTFDIPTVFGCCIPEGVPPMAIFSAELYVVATGICYIGGFNLLSCILFLLIAEQFRILNKKMQSLDIPRIEENDIKQCLQELKEITAYHNFLLNCVKDLNTIFSIPLFFQLGCDIFLLCVNMYVVSMPETTAIEMALSLVLCVEVTGSFLGLAGLPAQLLMDEAAEVSNSIYFHCDWYLADYPIRKHLLLMLVRSQTPITITAGAFTDVNNTTILMLVKTAYSFFTYIQTMS